MADLSPDPSDDTMEHPGFDAWLRQAGPAPEPGDTWSDEDPPPLAHPGVRGIHSGQTRRVLVAVGVLAVLAVTVGALMLPHGPSPELAVVLRGSGSAGPTAATTTLPRPPITTTPVAVKRATATTISTTPQWTTLTVQAPKIWRRGDVVQTNRIQLTLQSSGDFVIIDQFGQVRWHSGTGGHGNFAVFQNDGRLVVYDRSMRTLWESSDSDNDYPGAVLVLQANGDVDIIFHGRTVWSAGTAN
jgi:hypothetical protein